MDSKQTTNHLLMVRPAHFAFNEETAGSNAFQQRSGDDATNSLQQQALEVLEDSKRRALAMNEKKSS